MSAMTTPRHGDTVSGCGPRLPDSRYTFVVAFGPGKKSDCVKPSSVMDAVLISTIQNCCPSLASAIFPPSLLWGQAEHVKGSEMLGWKVSVSLVLISNSSQFPLWMLPG